MTRVNMDFTQESVTRGSSSSPIHSMKENRPVKSIWRLADDISGTFTITRRARESWFAFDHYYSDGAFNAACLMYSPTTPQHCTM